MLRYLLIGLFAFLSCNFLNAQKHEWAKAIKLIKQIDTLYPSFHPDHIESDSKGNVYTSSPLSGIYDFDPNSGTAIDSSRENDWINGFIWQLDSNGFYNWHQKLVGYRVIPYATEIDQRDNLYVSGLYTDSLSIDTSVILSKDSSTQYTDFLIKFREDNSFQFAVNFQKTSWHAGNTILTDTNNNIYLTGTVIAERGQDSVDMNPSTTEEYNIYAAQLTPYLLKLDSNGVFQWVKTFACCYHAVGINHFNNLFSYSYLRDTIINTPNGSDTIKLNYKYNQVLSRINPSNGNINWQTPIFSNQPTLFYNYPNHIELQTDALGNVYLFGTFADSLFIGTSPQTYISKGNRDGFISKFDSTGNLVWFTQFDGDNLNQFKSATINDSGNFFIGTELYGKYNFPTDSGQTSYFASPEKRMTLIKFKTNGEFDWAKPIEAGVGSQIEAIDWSRATNSIYSTGTYKQQLIAGDTLSTNSRYELFITKTKLCDPILFYDTLYLCAGDSSYIPNVQTFHSGRYRKLVESSFGCDSMIHTLLTVYPAYQDTVIYSTCQGDSVLYEGSYYKKDTMLESYSTTLHGCDSNSVIIFRIDSTNLIEQSLEICDGDTIVIGNKNYVETGLYSDTLVSFFGCDSIINTTLKVNENQLVDQNVNLCNGDTLRVGDNAYFENGSYQDTLQTAEGCDSIIQTSLTISPKYNFNQSFILCRGDSVRVGNNYYDRDGSYSDVLVSVDGCDSLVETSISIPSFKLIHSGRTLRLSSQYFPPNHQFQWMNCETNEKIFGEISQTFNYTKSGSYSVVVSFDDCKDTLSCIETELQLPYELKIQPNPARDFSMITIPSRGSIKLYDSKSSFVSEKVFDFAGEHQLSLLPFPAGMYIVVFDGNQGRLTKKFSVIK